MKIHYPACEYLNVFQRFHNIEAWLLLLGILWYRVNNRYIYPTQRKYIFWKFKWHFRNLFILCILKSVCFYLFLSIQKFYFLFLMLCFLKLSVGKNNDIVVFYFFITSSILYKKKILLSFRKYVYLYIIFPKSWIFSKFFIKYQF